MSTINVTNLKGRNGSPNLPDGANVTGVVTATSFDGSLKTTGTPTLGLGVTINASGVAISGVLTATTFKGDGSNLTGVGESIAPWHYNPDLLDTEVPVDTGIGITFNKKVSAGSGTATLKIVNAGAAGTTIQSWGVSSCTFDVNALTMGALVSNLTVDKTYQVDIPSGFIVDSTGTDYAGTAYTFTASPAVGKVWAMGRGGTGQLGNNSAVTRSSPIQIPGTTWDFSALGECNNWDGNHFGMVRTDGTLWTWGKPDHGALGNSSTAVNYSSPVQIPGTTWATYSHGYYNSYATKTDGTLWAWGYNAHGQLGINDRTSYSSPKQIPGTTWLRVSGGDNSAGAIKTDGTLWTWGRNHFGELGHNSEIYKSSPVQVPGTTWKQFSSFGHYGSVAVKTDGTLWAFGRNNDGQLGQNSPGPSHRSSPIQVPGTTWAAASGTYDAIIATKTNGTLWTWGINNYGQLGQNNAVKYSSPVQIPGTTWSTDRQAITGGDTTVLAVKTDGTLWSWGNNEQGKLGHNQDDVHYSSPVQVGSETEWNGVVCNGRSVFISQLDQTP